MFKKLHIHHKRARTTNSPSLSSIFGIPIKELPLNENGVPYFLPVVINQLIDQRKEEGILRRAGNKIVIDELGCRALDPAFSVGPNVTVHDLASFLKKWIRELPSPIITPSIINKYYKDDSIDTTKKILMHLNEVNRKCVAMIFSLMILISDQSEINLMTLPNIFICILPSITQSYKDIKVQFKFSQFFDNCIDLMNADGNDFLLDCKKN